MRALVTGGAGYIGSHMVAHLLDLGHEVVVLDDLSTGHAEALPAQVRHLPLKLGREGDRRALTDFLVDFRPEVTFHFAGRSQVGESMRAPGLYWQENVVGSLHLLQALLEAGCGRLVFSSTAAVYGVPTQVPIDETHPLSPINPYGHSKAAVEALIDGHRPLGVSAMILRYFNAAGAARGLRERHDPETHLCPIVADAALGRRGALTLHGDDYPTPDGSALRDYVHVDDLVRAHELAARHLLEGGDGGVFNLGTGQGHSVREVVAAFERAAQTSIAVEVGPRRAGDPPALVASNARAKAVLGWAPRRSLQQIAADTLASRSG